MLSDFALSRCERVAAGYVLSQLRPSQIAHQRSFRALWGPLRDPNDIGGFVINRPLGNDKRQVRFSAPVELCLRLLEGVVKWILLRRYPVRMIRRQKKLCSSAPLQPFNVYATNHQQVYSRTSDWSKRKHHSQSCGGQVESFDGLY